MVEVASLVQGGPTEVVLLVLLDPRVKQELADLLVCHHGRGGAYRTFAAALR